MTLWVDAQSAAEALARRVVEYLAALDTSVEVLSAHHEGLLNSMPTYLLTTRHVAVWVGGPSKLAVVDVTPDDSLTADSITASTFEADPIALERFGEGLAIHAGVHARAARKPPPFFFMTADFVIASRDRPLDPEYSEPGILASGDYDAVVANLDPRRAPEHAIAMWNQRTKNLPPATSLVAEIAAVFETFSKIVRRKAFLERRVHRYLNTHAQHLLPSFRRHWSEVPLRRGTAVRRADLVLERESGLPGVWVELESPAVRVFRKNGELSAEANHARAQIAEWEEFVRSNATENAAGDLRFLAGPMQRLIVIGRGMEHRDRMLASVYTDTTVWTYDFLLEQARARWATLINGQRELLGLDRIPLFGHPA